MLLSLQLEDTDMLLAAVAEFPNYQIQACSGC